jgi:DNA-binding MarR family transcriptional regulator
MLNLLRTADRLTEPLERALKPAGLSRTQYNVLRILRGISPDGISCQEIARRMITRDADLTRLVDRLEKRALVARHRQAKDRRVVHLIIVPAGLTLLADLDQTVADANKRALGHLPPEDLQQLINLLELARDSVDKKKDLLTD